MIRLSTVRMTSPLEIRIVEPHETRALRKRAKKAFDHAIAEVDRLTALLSEYREDSEVSRINRNAGRSHLYVSQDTANVLDLALEVAHTTFGAFDPTFRPLLDLWDYNQNHVELPEESRVQKILKCVDYRQVEFDYAHRRVRLAKPGMKLGLGGIAKGYIVQAMVEVLKQYQFENFLVNAGGDIFASGTCKGKSWQVGVPDPVHSKRMAFSIPVRNAAFCTSACYERYVVIDGQRYGHIINPKTGYPVEYTKGVTVIANKMAYADAIATTIFVLGPRLGLQFANQLKGTEVLIFDGQGKLSISEGLKHSCEKPQFGTHRV